MNYRIYHRYTFAETPTLKQRQIFDILGIKYVYKGEEQNCEPQAPQDL